VIVAGIGCRRGCAAADIVALVQLAQRQAGCRVEALAAPEFKRDEAGLHEAAGMLQVDLQFIDATALAAVQPHCPTRSVAAAEHTGIASVAEGSALAATGGRLLLARIANGQATCALAAGA